MAPPTNYGTLLERALAWAVVFHDASTLEDAFELGMVRLLRELGHDDAPQHVHLLGVSESEVARLKVGQRFADALESLEDRRRQILLRRVFAEEPETLTALAAEYGVTRERVRQLETDAVDKVEAAVSLAMGSVADALSRAVGPVARAEEVQRGAERLTSDSPPATHQVAVRALLSYTDYQMGRSLTYSRGFQEVLERIKTETRAMADEWGLLEEAAVKGTAPGVPEDLWQDLLDEMGLARPSGYVALKDTQLTRVAAALRRIGHAATMDEIAEQAGLSARQVAPILSATDDMVRVTKDTWGFRAWTDDPYDGVVQEIIQRIIEGDGVASVEDLIHEIPSRFGVTENTVRVYLATDKFVVEKGKVTIADAVPTELRPLSELRQLVWDDKGRPFLPVRIQDQHLRGNSIKVPAEVAARLGVGPDERTALVVRVPEIPGTASVIWRSYDPAGPEVGRLRAAFEKLDVAAGDEVFILLDPTGLEIWNDGGGLSLGVARDPDVGEQRASSPRSVGLPASAAMAVDKLKSRRRLS